MGRQGYPHARSLTHSARGLGFERGEKSKSSVRSPARSLKQGAAAEGRKEEDELCVFSIRSWLFLNDDSLTWTQDE